MKAHKNILKLIIKEIGRYIKLIISPELQFKVQGLGPFTNVGIRNRNTFARYFKKKIMSVEMY